MTKIIEEGKEILVKVSGLMKKCEEKVTCAWNLFYVADHEFLCHFVKILLVSGIVVRLCRIRSSIIISVAT